jgi:hypothetical protein
MFEDDEDYDRFSELMFEDNKNELFSKFKCSLM